ncbi:MAG: fumarylacetoacetate hydrolase family protein [Alphaproteobacteria bacterium]|nr:fumarylacetoacetate hydrolase family protein [Alphaproteobacteria bacterium]
MMLATYSSAGENRVGAVVGDDLIDLLSAYAHLLHSRGEPEAAALAAAQLPTDLARILRRPDGLDVARAALDYGGGLEPNLARAGLVRRALADVVLLPPVPNPPKIICVARNYAEHAREAGLQVSEIPILFARFPATLVAPGQPIVRPTVSVQLDWEGELAVVIGRGGRHITRRDALRHVAGYSIFNDVTVRDYQFRVTQYTAGKNFDASGPFGPYLVLTDEVTDPQALEIVTDVSGVEMQRASTADMLFDVAMLIEHISEFIELEPGDVIATGTPAGVGFKREPPRFLTAGDVVRVSITKLGSLENPVEDEEPAEDEAPPEHAAYAEASGER